MSVAEVDSAATATYSTTSATIPSIPETLTPDFNEAAASKIASTYVAEASFEEAVAKENAEGAIANPEFPAKQSSPLKARIVAGAECLEEMAEIEKVDAAAAFPGRRSSEMTFEDGKIAKTASMEHQSAEIEYEDESAAIQTQRAQTALKSGRLAKADVAVEVAAEDVAVGASDVAYSATPEG